MNRSEVSDVEGFMVMRRKNKQQKVVSEYKKGFGPLHHGIKYIPYEVSCQFHRKYNTIGGKYERLLKPWETKKPRLSYRAVMGFVYFKP